MYNNCLRHDPTAPVLYAVSTEAHEIPRAPKIVKNADDDDNNKENVIKLELNAHV